MNWKVTTQPTVEPVSLAEAKLHLRVDTSDEDTLITSLIKTAREYCEGIQNRAYIEQTVTLNLDDFSDDEICVPQPPLISVTSIKYLDENGVQQTLASSVYDVDTTSEPGRIVPAYNQSWPSVRGDINSVEIVYTAGYGSSADNVPESVKSAMKLLLTHYYENRGDSNMEVPGSIRSLLSLNRNGY